MICVEELKPGKRENIFHVEYEEFEKTGSDSPNNRMFYAYVWDPVQKKRIATLLDSSKLMFKDEQ